MDVSFRQGPLGGSLHARYGAGAAAGRLLDALRRAVARLGKPTAALIVALIWGAWAGPVQAASSPAPPSAAPTIYVLTFGPGDETFSKFGHDAIWVHDPAQPPRGRDLVFNYGTFRFDSPWLILDFLKGKLRYWLSVTTLDRTLGAYRAQNRSVSSQELALLPEVAREITAFLHENVKPENAYYRYDYYRDNCATRIRDVLDQHLGHALANASRGPAQLTYREHTRRLTVDSPILFFALDLALGPLIDRPITEWEEMFLPARVEAILARLSDPRGQPLVRERRSLFDARRAPSLQGAPAYGWGWLVLGGAFAAGLYALSRVPRRWSEVALAGAVGCVGAFTAVLGSLLLVLWLFTDHDVTYWNQNVLLCPIWGFAISVLAVDFGHRQPRHAGLMMGLVAASLGSAILALALRILLRGSQQAGPALSLFVPLWLGVALAVWERLGRPRPRALAAWRAAPAEGHQPSIAPLQHRVAARWAEMRKSPP
jgi:hypothetical protein